MALRQAPARLVAGRGHPRRTRPRRRASTQPAPAELVLRHPGIARAQQLAGLALGDARRQHLAEDALAWCVTDEAQLAQLSDVSLCHGWAGLLHTAWRAGAHDERIRAALPRMLDGLADSLLHRPPRERSLLVGETGALLAQHAATTNTPPATQWDACLLLND